MKSFLAALLFLVVPSFLFGLSSSAYVPISPTGGNAAPTLAVGGNGNAFAAWLNFPNNIQTAFFNAATNQWTFLGNLTVGSVPQIGIDQTGNAFIIWVSTTFGSTSQILVSRLNAANLTFSAPVQLSVTGTINIAPQISVNASGFAVAVWIQNTPFQVLGASYSPLTGTWSSATPILSNTFPATFALDNVNTGVAIQDSFSGTVQGVIQAARIFAP